MVINEFCDACHNDNFDFINENIAKININTHNT